jgi:prephenate dehydrogenase
VTCPANVTQRDVMFKKVAVFGLGLLGGSICRGLKKINADTRISAIGRSPEKLEPALKDRVVDEIGGFDGMSLSGVDLAVVSMPVDPSIDIIRRILSSSELDPGAIVIDVGSVKEKIIRSVERLVRSDQFIGCHPMAGSEKMGYEYSREDLYSGSSVIITPHARNREGDVRAVRQFWEALKALTVIISPEEHDLIMAYTSHLPHIVASSLVRVFYNFKQERGAGDFGAFIGKGFLDATRISSGSPDMWRDIVALNRENILAALDRMIEELRILRNAVSGPEAETGPLHDYFRMAKSIRDGLK